MVETTSTGGVEELKKKVIPIIKHKEYKILSTMSYLIAYLYAEYPDKMQSSGLYRTECGKQIQEYFEWYQNNLRPCIKQMIRFTVTRFNAGLDVMQINENEEEQKDGDSSPKDKEHLTPASGVSSVRTPLTNFEHLEGENRTN